jgi:Phasin protein
MARMAEQTHDPYQKAAPLFSWPVAMNGAAQDAFGRAGEVWQRAAAAWQQEMIRFTTDRLQKNSETSREALACRGWDEMAKLQQKWLTSAAEDYAGVMSRMGEIATGFGKEIEQAAERSTEESRSVVAAARHAAAE